MRDKKAALVGESARSKGLGNDHDRSRKGKKDR